MLWHLKKPNLTKSPEPNPDTDLRLPKTRKHSKTETGKPSQNSVQAEFWSFCTRLLHKKDLGVQGSFGIKKATTYQKPQAKAGHSPPSSKDEKTLQEENRQITAKSCAFCSFCAFAERNAVSLAKTGCKGALAPKKP